MLQSGHMDRVVNLTISTGNGSAQAPKDYTGLKLEFAFDGDRKCIDVVIINDDVVENNESFLLILNSTDVSVSLHLPTISVTIIDDDIAMIGFQQTQYTVSESIGQLNLVIELAGYVERSISVIVESRDWTASAYSGDYSALADTLLFPSGSETGSTLTVAVDIRDDSLIEEVEQFSIHVMSLDVATQPYEGKNTTTVFIVDDDRKCDS